MFMTLRHKYSLNHYGTKDHIKHALARDTLLKQYAFKATKLQIVLTIRRCFNNAFLHGYFAQYNLEVFFRGVVLN